MQHLDFSIQAPACKGKCAVYQAAEVLQSRVSCHLEGKENASEEQFLSEGGLLASVAVNLDSQMT